MQYKYILNIAVSYHKKTPYNIIAVDNVISIVQDKIKHNWVRSIIQVENEVNVCETCFAVLIFGEGIPSLDTHGGTAGGSKCKFPFFYLGVWNFR